MCLLYAPDIQLYNQSTIEYVIHCIEYEEGKKEKEKKRCIISKHLMQTKYKTITERLDYEIMKTMKYPINCYNVHFLISSLSNNWRHQN